jgi:hypothetical protein
MLSLSAYPQKYIDEARARIAVQVSAFAELAREVRGAVPAGSAGTQAALDALEPEYFANMVIALDSHFVHRSRGQERKDGNAMNEVRVLVSSIQQHDSIMTAEKGIRLEASRSVLGIEYGDRIRIEAEGFERLARAFFEALEATYSEPNRV